jgi:hypothetical protein
MAGSMAIIFSRVCYSVTIEKAAWHVPRAIQQEINTHGLQHNDIVILLYDVRDRLTFDVLPEIITWTRHLRTTMPQLVLIATKTEIPQEKWDVSIEEAKSYANKVGANFGTYARDEVIEVVRPAIEAVGELKYRAEMEEHSHTEMPKELQSHHSSPRDDSNPIQRLWRKLRNRKAD